MSSDDRDPPLFDALWTLSGLTARHQLREDPAMSQQHLPSGWSWTPPPERPDQFGAGHRYGSDDPPGGPPAPPLGQEDVVEPSPMGFDEIEPGHLVACPTCGGGVTPDRLR